MRRVHLAAELVAVALLLALVAVYAASPIFSVDFFWHLKLGEVIRQTGSIPRTDLFSAVHPERAYVQFNWLWEVAAAQIQAAFGLHGIRIAQALLLVASYALLYAVSRRALASGPLAFAFCALALVMFQDRFRARPSALALGFFAAMIPWLLGAYRQRLSLGRGAWILGLSVLWANLHGGESVLLLLSFGALLAGELCNRRLLGRQDAAVRAAAWLCGLGALGLATSPTLIDGVAHWAVAVVPQIETGNQEWQPSYTMLQNGWRPTFVLVGLGPTAVALAYIAEQVVRVRRHGRSAIDASEWLLCAGYLVLSHQAVRNAFLCLLPLLFMLRRHAPQLRDAKAAIASIAVALVLLGMSFEVAVLHGYGGLERARALSKLDLSPNTYPEHLARFVRQAGIKGRILNDGRWGGYLIWQTWPRCHVFADSRHDLTTEMWPLFIAAHRPLERPLALRDGFARYGLELSAFEGPTFPLLAAPSDWQLLFKAGREELYQNVRGEHAQANLAAARAWLERQRPAPSAVTDRTAFDLSDAATRVGAALWLRDPLTRFRLRDAQRAEASRDPAARADGHSQHGLILWEAGLYRDALTQLERASELEPLAMRPRYYAALAHFALGETARAQAQLEVLAAHQTQLSPAQRERLALLDRATRAKRVAVPR